MGRHVLQTLDAFLGRRMRGEETEETFAAQGIHDEQMGGRGVIGQRHRGVRVPVGNLGERARQGQGIADQLGAAARCEWAGP